MARLLLVIMCLVVWTTVVSAQGSTDKGPTAWRLRSIATAPGGTCISGPPVTEIYIRTTSPRKIYICEGGVFVELVIAGSGLADPGSNGIVKRTALNTTTIAVAGTDYFAPGGTDIPVADGGTGASSAATARTNLGAFGGSTGAVDNSLLRADGTGGVTGQNTPEVIVNDGGQFAITQGALVASLPFINHTITWNNGGTLFTNFLSDTTELASAANSLLMDLRLNGATEFSVDKDGDVVGNSFSTNAAGVGVLGLGDTDGSHELRFTPGSNLTANRTLTITTGDANRTLDLSAGLPVAVTVASGTSALGTSAIASGVCASAVTTAATGTATTDVISWGFNGDPTGVVGYQPATTGMLTIIAYPSANNANFKVCNNTSASITPGAITLNWRVIR